MINPVKQLRQLTGLTQEDFCEEIEVDRTYLSKLENGKNDMGVLKFLSWCKIFNINPNQIFNNYIP